MSLKSDDEASAPDAKEHPTWVLLPPFQGKDVKVWWTQVELKLKTAEITDPVAKYECVASGIPWVIAKHVTELLTTEPTVDSFEKLKEGILKEYV